MARGFLSLVAGKFAQSWGGAVSRSGVSALKCGVSARNNDGKKFEIDIFAQIRRVLAQNCDEKKPEIDILAQISAVLKSETNVLAPGIGVYARKRDALESDVCVLAQMDDVLAHN